MRAGEFRFLRALASLPARRRACVRNDVDAAGKPANLVAMNAFGPGQVAEYGNQLRIVVSLHLVGKQIVAFRRIDFDLIRDCEQIG